MSTSNAWTDCIGELVIYCMLYLKFWSCVIPTLSVVSSCLVLLGLRITFRSKVNESVSTGILVVDILLPVGHDQ